VCGICSTSSYVCAPDNLSTSCTTPDDRKAGKDTDYEPTSTAGVTPYFGRNVDFGIAYTTAHKGAITDVKVLVRRTGYFCTSTPTIPHPDPACDSCTYNAVSHKYDCTVSTPVDAALTVSLYTGVPSTGGTPVATSTMGLMGTFSTTDGWVTIPLTSAPTLASGTAVWVLFHTTSSKYALVMEGGLVSASAPPNGETGNYAYVYPISPATTAWTGPTAYAPSFIVDMDGCGF
jgi:hypothetical protein